MSKFQETIDSDCYMAPEKIGKILHDQVDMGDNICINSDKIYTVTTLPTSTTFLDFPSDDCNRFVEIQSDHSTHDLMFNSDGYSHVPKIIFQDSIFEYVNTLTPNPIQTIREDF